MQKILKKYLEEHKITYEEFEHPPIFTVEEAKSIKNKVPGLHCKCLFLEDNLKHLYLVGMPAEKRLDIKKLQVHLNVKKLRFGSEKDLKKLLDLTPGSVSIFGMINNSQKNVKLIITKEVWEAKKVGFHPNINTSTLVLTHRNLEKYFDSLDCGKEILEL